MTEQTFIAHTESGDLRGVQGGEGFPLLLLHGGPGLTDYMALLDTETGSLGCLQHPTPCGRLVSSITNRPRGSEAVMKCHLTADLGSRSDSRRGEANGVFPGFFRSAVRKMEPASGPP